MSVTSPSDLGVCKLGRFALDKNSSIRRMGLKKALSDSQILFKTFSAELGSKRDLLSLTHFPLTFPDLSPADGLSHLFVDRCTVRKSN